MTDLADLSARTLAGLIRAREASPVEAVEAVLRRVVERADLNAFITVAADEARAAAREAEAAVMRGEALGPLHGLPLSVKDLVDTAGIRTTFGSAVFEHNVPTTDAVSVARAKAAGAIVIGKTTTPEFGHKQRTDAPLFGQTLNPIDPRFTCGASSGGAAVAVAAGMGPLAIGTDGGGSIRIPASCCGVVGLKGTLGAIPHLQVPDLFAANSYVGPMARNVADTALLFEAIAGPDPGDPYGLAGLTPDLGPEGWAGTRVAWLPRCGNPLDPEVEAATVAALRRIEAAGAVIQEIDLDFVALEPVFLTILQSALAARLADKLPVFRERLDPSLVATIERGLERSGVEVQRAAAARTACFRQIQAVFRTYDLIVSPTLSAPPLPVAQDPNGRVAIAGVDAGTIRGAWYPYTYPFNLTGHPALSLPCGRSRNGLPIGLQLVGPWHADRSLLRLAGKLETLLGEVSSKLEDEAGSMLCE